MNFRLSRFPNTTEAPSKIERFSFQSETTLIICFLFFVLSEFSAWNLSDFIENIKRYCSIYQATKKDALANGKSRPGTAWSRKQFPTFPKLSFQSLSQFYALSKWACLMNRLEIKLNYARQQRMIYCLFQFLKTVKIDRVNYFFGEVKFLKWWKAVARLLHVLGESRFHSVHRNALWCEKPFLLVWIPLRNLRSFV